MHLQHDSWPFLALESHFTAFWLGHAQKSKFWDSYWTSMWPTSLDFSIFGFFFPFLFLLLSSFCCSDWHSTGLVVKKTPNKASLRQPILTMEQPGVEARNFALSFLLIFLSIFVHISGSIRPVTLIWASLERSFPPAEFEYRWCQFWSKMIKSEVEERPRFVTGGYGRHRRQWVKLGNSLLAQIP